MHGFIRASMRLTLIGFTAALLSCAGTESRQAPLQPAPISDFRQVAGKWGGLLKTVPPSRQDWVDLAIKENGTYRFSSFRTIGELFGSGTSVITDGRLMAEGDKGRATFTLYESGVGRMLKVDATTKSGLRYSADLTPAK
ncbi:MAG: hypothetical protein ACREJU_16255 [Nitrospiraceae bacterium]